MQQLCLQVGNIWLGIPVRVTRRNKDSDSIYGCTYIYDGLYNVVRLRSHMLKSCQERRVGLNKLSV